MAFYSSSSDSFNFTLGGFAGVGGAASKYPGTDFYAKGSDGSWFGDFRLLTDADTEEGLAASLNILENVRSKPPLFPGSAGQFQRDVERSGLVYWQQHDSPNTQAAMVIDSAYIRYGNEDNELIVGRQPISTSVTFFFTPNDFFAPFSPNTFFRVYKPGVDALRYERKLKALSQLSLISVLGYDEDPDADSGWTAEPDWQRTTVLARLTDTVGNFEFGGIFGSVREALVTGFSWQGEVFDWLGLRGEGHYAGSMSGDVDSGFMATVSLEHRFVSSLNLRLEYMYNGYGSDSVAEALAAGRKSASGQQYLGRHYAALDLGYEITPLLFGEMLYLQNLTDDSYSVSFNAVFSVSDESEAAVTFSIPGGTKPEDGAFTSELGALPVQFSIEYRQYF